MTTTPTVAVITSSIGRLSLLNTIDCIKKQSYPCRHYVFVDGEQHHQAVKKMLKAHPEIVVTYLPVSTGATGMCNSIINAIAPFIATEDIICYVDDDNTVSEDHIKHLAEAISHHDSDYAYSLRYLVSKEDDYQVADNLESLGFWSLPNQHTISVDFQLNNKQQNFNLIQTRNSTMLIDTNCYGFRRKLAQTLANIWMINGKHNDKNITEFLFANPKFTGVCTGKRTVYYKAELKNFVQPPQNIYDYFEATDIKDQRNLQRQLFLSYINYIDTITLGHRPWETPTVFKNGQLITMADK
ncbi:glycosyltransferase [uncultured Moraxella sp.]|uniref:glycosyltransferase n=1 Tax=uncultured Moraxella sp. TaxID=263769 RepID=UPI0025D5ADD1|nr:glycosyltransferase [uncultured Moraxella sp.]